MSYRKLEIWQNARKLVIDIHKMTLIKKINRFIQSVDAEHRTDR